MAETFTLSELVIPGTYIDVRAEALIGAGAVSTGNIGIVGTARKLDENGDPIDITGETYALSGYEEAREELGRYDAYEEGEGNLNLTRAIEILFRNGARTVYARPLALGANDAQPGTDAYEAAFNELLKDDVNILIAPQLSTDDALGVLPPILESAESNSRDLIAVVGSDATEVDDITDQVVSDDRLVLVAPGIKTRESVIEDGAPVSRDVTLSGTYTAAAVAGLLSTLAPEESPTNKVLSGVTDLAQRFSYAEERDLITGGVLVLERRLGVRVVRGITTQMAENGPFRQITTRRITDFAKAGIRQASNPFIGRLNNQRVRAALRAAIDGFLATMVLDEALIGYTLEVTATRQDEIEGRALVNAVIQPTFSIDFVAVTMALE
jgi:hypothetical protein